MCPLTNKNTWYLYIKIGAPKVNDQESAMYIQVRQVQMEYLSEKPPFNAKMVEQPGGHRREGSTG